MRSCVQIFDLYGIYTGCTWVVLGMMISPPRDLMSCLPLAIPFVVSHQSLVVIAVENIRSFTEGSVITVEKEERGGGNTPSGGGWRWLSVCGMWCSSASPAASCPSCDGHSKLGELLVEDVWVTVLKPKLKSMNRMAYVPGWSMCRM